MIVFENDEKKIESYNARRIELLEELRIREPECYEYMAQWYKELNSIDDMFCPYAKWIESITQEEKQNLRVIEDENRNFAGVYIVADFNDHYKIPKLTDWEEVKGIFWDYGVVDNATQILKNVDVPENAVVLMTPIFKNKKEPGSGWRWHKWGPYYGVQNHQCEYLNDEKDVEMVYAFDVYRLKKKEA